MKTPGFLFGALLLLCASSCGDGEGKTSPPPFDFQQLSGWLLQAKDASLNAEERVAALEKALEAVQGQTPGLYNDSIAEACLLIGRIFFDVSDYDSARLFFSHGLGFDPQGQVLGRMACNFGLAYHNENQYFSSLQYFEMARAAEPVNPESRYYLIATVYMGNAYLKLGQPHLALPFLENAMDLAAKGQIAGDIALACQLLSDCLRELRRYGEAIEAGQKGIEAATAAGDNERLANCHNHVGNAWQDSLLVCDPGSQAWTDAGRRAEDHYLLAQQLEARNDRKVNELTIWSNRGELFRRRKDISRAKAVLSDAIGEMGGAGIRSFDERRLLGLLLINRGEAFMDAGEFAAAQSDFDSALYYLAPGYARSKIADNPVASPHLVAMALHNRAALAVKKAKSTGGPSQFTALKDALPLYDDLVDYLRDARRGFLTEQDKILLVQRSKPYLDNAFRLCLELQALEPGHIRYHDKAFEFSEQSKALALLETLQDKMMSAGLDEQYKAERAALMAERTHIDNEFSLRPNDSAALAIYEEQWRAHMGRWRQFQEKLPPAARDFMHDDDIPAAEFRRSLLDDDQAMLVYHETNDSTLYVFLMKKQGLQLAVVPIDKVFYEDIARFETLVSRKDEKALDKEALFCAVARRLYDKLIPGELRASLTPRLIVAPSDKLQSIPFEALWTGDDAGAFSSLEKAKKHYLLFSHAFSYAPSANLLWAMHKQEGKQKNTGKIAVFAPEFPETASTGIAGAVPALEDASAGSKFTYLPNYSEIEGIGKQVAVKKFRAERATKQNFWDACQKHPVVHISTHGELFQDPRNNRIIFAGEKGAPERYQSLFLHELLNRSEGLNLDMAGLIACETGQGAHVESEGKISIARGLTAAGVRSFVVAYWSINGHNSEALMPLFYNKLMQKESAAKDMAMAEAKIAFIEESARNLHPFDWAGLIIIGNTEPLDLEPPGSGTRYIWILPALLLFAVVIRRRRKRSAAN